VFYVRSPPAGIDAGIVMEYAEFRRLGNKLFVVGRIPEIVNAGWASRLQSAVSWDSVVHYLIFDSREDYQTRIASGKPSLLRRLFG
jgi:hypothetical protein